MVSRPALALFPTTLLFFSLCVYPGAAIGDDPSPSVDRGAEIFRALCAECHGADGQGSDSGYDEPLLGDQDIAQLAVLIEETMPEGEPEACIGEEAKQVATYIFREFYSPQARRRKGLLPAPRVDLVRLTVTQHRNAVADLIGHFTPPPRYEVPPTDDAKTRDYDDLKSVPTVFRNEPGLRAEYFQSRGMSKAETLHLQRVDRRIEFDFGSGSPHADISADQFTIIWDGSLIARDTGVYEFRVRTENGARLYVNHDAPEIRRSLRDDSSVAGSEALIDAWVSSGQLREESARIFLLAGRRYPLRLEFFKYLDQSASIALEWKPPGGVWSVLDHNHLLTIPSRRSFAADVPFPADDRSLGYERGSAVSRQWHTAASELAVATAAEVIDRLPVLASLDPETQQRESALRQFAIMFAERAFRRPLQAGETERIDAMLTDDPNDLDAGLIRVVLSVLKSPNFLYANLPLDDELQSHSAASQLALVLWDSIPDTELSTAASQGSLATEEQISAQAERMLPDERTRAKIASFFRHWLEIEQRDLSKDRERFPEFDESVIADLRYSLERFVDQVVWSERSDYRNLLQADYLILNDRLRRLYDPEWNESNSADRSPASWEVGDFRQFVFSDQQRAGVLTHPYLMSAFAYHNNTSPIHRGVFLTQNIVGRALKPPPEAVAFKDDEFPDDLTMREKITLLTRDSGCMGCHAVINPLGFALENFDPLGRWRTVDNEKPVDTKTQYLTAEGTTIEFQNAVDVAKFAAENETAHRAFVTQLFHHFVKQDPAAFGEKTTDQLVESWVEDKFNVQNLLVRMAVVAAKSRPVATPDAEPQSEGDNANAGNAELPTSHPSVAKTIQPHSK